MATNDSGTAARRAARAAFALTVAAVVAVGVVAVVHDLAAPRIEASRAAAQREQLTAVLGGIAYDNDPLTDTVQVRDPEHLGTGEALVVHRVRRGGEPVAALLHAVAPDGYAGSLRLLVAVDARGRLIGVRVLEHRETPGLGDFVEERRTDWIRQFDGRSLGEPPADRWQVRKDGGDFDQYTGATITSRAVTRAVRDALAYFTGHRSELLAAPAAPAAP